MPKSEQLIQGEIRRPQLSKACIFRQFSVVDFKAAVSGTYSHFNTKEMSEEIDEIRNSIDKIHESTEDMLESLEEICNCVQEARERVKEITEIIKEMRE
jgi:methyl-accepting chemotaxis protein